MGRIVFLLFSLVWVGMPIGSMAADVNININIPPQSPPEQVVVEPAPPIVAESVDVVEPPLLQFDRAPDVVVVPSGTSYVYMASGIPGVYFYNGFWYRYYDGYWFRSSIYSGPWLFVDTYIVPRVVVSVPPEYPLFLPPTYFRIHYTDFYRGWRSWDYDRRWNRYDWFKRELREDIRRDRFTRIVGERERLFNSGERRAGFVPFDRGKLGGQAGARDQGGARRGAQTTGKDKLGGLLGGKQGGQAGARDQGSAKPGGQTSGKDKLGGLLGGKQGGQAGARDQGSAKPDGQTSGKDKLGGLLGGKQGGQAGAGDQGGTKRGAQTTGKDKLGGLLGGQQGGQKNPGQSQTRTSLPLKQGDKPARQGEKEHQGAGERNAPNPFAR